MDLELLARIFKIKARRKPEVLQQQRLTVTFIVTTIQNKMGKVEVRGFVALKLCFGAAIVIILASATHGNDTGLVHRRFEYKYSFKPPYLAQKDSSVPFWEYGGSKWKIIFCGRVYKGGFVSWKFRDISQRRTKFIKS